MMAGLCSKKPCEPPALCRLQKCLHTQKENPCGNHLGDCLDMLAVYEPSTSIAIICNRAVAWQMDPASLHYRTSLGSIASGNFKTSLAAPSALYCTNSQNRVYLFFEGWFLGHPNGQLSPLLSRWVYKNSSHCGQGLEHMCQIMPEILGTFQVCRRWPRYRTCHACTQSGGCFSRVWSIHHPFYTEY